MNHDDRNLVQGCGQFKVFEEISSLQFVVHCPSHYIGKSCVAELRKQRGLHDNLKKIDEDLFNEYSSKAFKAGLTFQESVDSSASPEKRILLDESVSCSPNSITSPLTSTPAKTARSVTTVPISPVRPVILERSDEDRGKTVVEVKIQWPCNKNKVMSQRDHNHNLCEIQNSNSGILEHD